MPRLAQRLEQRGDPVGVPVVVAQHGEHGHVQAAAGVRDDRGLLGLAVGGQVAGEQQQVGLRRAARRTPAMASSRRAVPQCTSPAAAMRSVLPGAPAGRG